MQSFGVVVLLPLPGKMLGFGQGVEIVHLEEFVAQPAVE